MAWYLGAGVSKNNVGMAIGTYGLIWIFWLLLNRILCEHLVMLDAYLNFAQIGRFPSHTPAIVSASGRTELDTDSPSSDVSHDGARCRFVLVSHVSHILLVSCV